MGVTFRDRTLWVYDTALSAWLMTFIDEVAVSPVGVRSKLASTTGAAAVQAAMGADIAFVVERHVASDDLPLFIDLATTASARIRALRTIDWAALRERVAVPPDGAGPALRPVVRLLADPREMPSPDDVASIGDVFAEIAEGRFPRAPAGTWWFIGAPGGRRPIKMQADAPPG